MSPAASPGQKLRWQFDEFVVDPVRRVLLRDGEPVTVTPKALSILFALLEKPGEVVTKQELIQKIWPDTFVTEANLTQNISSLRKALGERANDRGYIVTVPGRGYSFTGHPVPVEIPPDESDASGERPAFELGAPPSAETELFAPPPEPGRSSGVWRRASIGAGPASSPGMPILAPPPPETPVAPRWGWRRLAPAALALVVLAAIAVIWLSGRRNPPAPAPAPVPEPVPAAAVAPVAQRAAVAVLGFRNLSGDRGADWLAPALAEMLTTEMAAGSKMRVISGDNILRARRSLSLPYTDHLEKMEMERLHSFLGADLVVVGAYLALGKEDGRRIRLDLRILRIPDGEALRSLSEVGTQAELFDLVSRTGADLRQALGLAGLSEDEQRAVRALRPSSTESERLYVQGLSRLRAFDPPGARDVLSRAVAVDPASALIHSALSQTWSALGYDAKAVEEAKKALDLSASLSREDRLAIEARWHVARKDWAKASETYRSLWTFFPDDLDYGLQLATSLISGGRGADAKAAVAALRRLPQPAADDPRIDLVEARIAFRTSDLRAQQRAAAAAIAKGQQSGERSVVAQGLVWDGNALLFQGKTDEAIRRFVDAKQIADKAGFRWVVGMALASLGSALQSQGDLDGAERANRESLAVAQQLGTALGTAAQYSSLAVVQRDRGDLNAVLPLLEQSRVWSAKIGDRMVQAYLLTVKSTVLCEQGDLKGALRSAENAVSESRETGNRTNEAEALQDFGRVLDLQDDLGAARRYYLQAFDAHRGLGNTALASTSLAASAEVLARLGDLGGARRRLEHALTAKQRAGDRLGTASVMGSLARLAYQAGDLVTAQSIVREQLRIAQTSGARALAAAALQSLGRTQLAAGDIDGARRTFATVIQASAGLGQHLQATAARLDLARVELAGGNVPAAVTAAREAAAWFGEHGMRGREAAALAVLAESHLRGGSLAAARQAANQARVQAEKSEDRQLRIAVVTRVARVDAASGNAAEALTALRGVIAEADKAGFVALGLEARLALGEVELAGGDRRGLETLGALRAEATKRGFELLARLAAGPLQGLRRLG
jgi:DNA-binding winged helix-turn-helix (wHTH) protein/tetratricopeptide (TPR) repeat protein